MFLFMFSSYHFHVIVDDGLVYLCMADEDFGKRQPYAFLEEVTFGVTYLYHRHYNLWQGASN